MNDTAPIDYEVIDYPEDFERVSTTVHHHIKVPPLIMLGFYLVVGAHVGALFGAIYLAAWCLHH